MNWIVKTVIGTAVGVTVTSVLIGGWRVYQSTQKIPGLLNASAKQQGQITNLRVTLLAFMEKTGHHPTKDDLERLLSSMNDFGASTAQLVQRANITITGRPSAEYYAWVPMVAQDTLRRSVATFARFAFTDDPQAIGIIITNSMVSADTGNWVFQHGLLMASSKAQTIMLTPKDKVTFSSLSSWVTEVNTIRATLRSVTVPATVVRKQGPMP